MTNTYTVKEIAKAVKLSPQVVNRYIRQGRLQATGRPARVSVDDLLAFMKMPRKHGRPAKQIV